MNTLPLTHTGELVAPSRTLPAELRKAVRMVWQRILGRARRPARRLRLAETLSLGERRFVAVVEFEQARFLLGGTSASLVLLARLEDRQPARADSGADAQSATEERP